MVAALARLGGGAIGGIRGFLAAGSWGLLPVEERTLVRAWILAVTCGILGGAVMIAVVQVVQSMLVRRVTGRGKSARVASGTLTDFGLDHRFRHRPRELSGGERQRVAIARALGSEPEILLADEPTGNLDAKTGKEILELLKERHDAGLTIVMVTHDSTVAAYADRVVRLEDGGVVEDSSTGDSSAASPPAG